MPSGRSWKELRVLDQVRAGASGEAKEGYEKPSLTVLGDFYALTQGSQLARVQGDRLVSSAV